VLVYLGEHVSRSKTPIVDALLVLYPAFAAALTHHQVQLSCAQELKELSDKELPLRVHYLYNRWQVRGHRMLKQRAADGKLDGSGVPSCVFWVHALCCSKCMLILCHAWRHAGWHDCMQHSTHCMVCIIADIPICSCTSNLSCFWRPMLSKRIAVAKSSEALLRQWLLPEHTIQGLPAEAVIDIRMWAWRYHATATSTTQALRQLKVRVERMRRAWQNANKRSLCVSSSA
jgi:hypothetical protein